MAKISNEEKLKAIKDFLRENNVDFVENYHSKNYNLDMALCIKNLMIAVFLSAIFVFSSPIFRSLVS